MRLGEAALPGPGEMRAVEACGRVLCVVGVEGGWRVLSDVCPHRGAPLHEGVLEGGRVVCPWHAWAFDLETGEAEHDPRTRVEVYPVRLSQGCVEVDL